MQDAIWHYSDAQGQQFGPFTAERIRDGLSRGEIALDARFWRDGLPGWIDLADASVELGIGPAAPDPYAAPSATNYAGEGAWRAGGDDVVPAGFWRRWAALFLDQLILAVPMVVVVVLVGGLSAVAGDQAGPFLTLLFYPLYYGMAGAYYSLQESSVHQATLGKRALGIKVTDAEGRRLSFQHALGRWFAAALSYLTLYVGFLMAAFTERKRALHDIVAGTLVVDRWAYTDQPERQKRDLSGCAIGGAIAVVILLAMLGIFAAIAISQYQEFTRRAQVSEALSLMDGAKTAVAEYRLNHDAFPASNAEAGLAPPGDLSGSYVSRVEVRRGGEILATFSSQPPRKADKALDGTSLRVVPKLEDDAVHWECSSASIPKKSCPASCTCP